MSSTKHAARDDGNRVRVGIAGWSYPDWRGIVYPQRRPGGFSELRFIAGMFDCVEVNCTFYRQVSPTTTAAWAKAVNDVPDFLFAVKASRELTHDEDATAARLRDACRELTGSVAPLADAGRLAGILLQFPWYFEDSSSHRERLALLAAELAPLPLFLEVRHRSFLGAAAEGALPFLERHGLNFTNIDLPRSRTSPPPSSINTGAYGYFRLHGRNRRTWFDPGAGRDQKYDYLYSRQELEQLVPYIERVAARTRATYVITNNHFRGQAAANAIQLSALLGNRPKAVPESLQREFPFLEEVASSSPVDRAARRVSG